MVKCLLPVLSAANPLTSAIMDQVRDQVTGEVQDFAEVPLGEVDAAQVSVCASLLLYGHKMTVTTAPNLIYHWQTDGTAPHSTRTDVVLTFQDDYWDNYLSIDRWVLEKLGNCTLPSARDDAGQTPGLVRVRRAESATQFDVFRPQTGVDGNGFATWSPSSKPRRLRDARSKISGMRWARSSFGQAASFRAGAAWSAQS